MYKLFNLIVLGVILLLVSCGKDNIESLTNETVNAVFVAADDVVWVGTNDGLRSIKEENIKSYDGLKINGIIKNISQSHKTNEVLIATTTGVYAISGNYEEPIAELKYTNESSALLSNLVNTINQDHLDRDWFGTANGVNRVKDGELIEVIDPDKYLEGVDINQMAFLYDSYFFATNGDYLVNAYYDPSTDAITGASVLDPEYNGALVADTIYCVVADADTCAWYGTAQGLTKSHRIYTHLLHEKIEYHLEGVPVYSVFIAQNGDVWAGTNEGVYQFDGTTWNRYQMLDGIAWKRVNAIDEDSKGNIWVGTSEGVLKFDGNNWMAY